MKPLSAEDVRRQLSLFNSIWWATYGETMQPCEQKEAIARLEVMTENISKTLDRLSSVLEKIATQGERIDHLAEGQNILFTRMRDMELQAESEKVRVGFIMAGISACVAGLVAYFSKHFGGH